MKNLGKISLFILNDKYSVQFKYSYPRKIDLFELILLEIIKHKNNIIDSTIENTLLMLEIPKEFHFIFLKKIDEFVNNKSKIIAFKSNNESDEDFIIISPNLNIMVSDFFLTPLGEKVLTSTQIVEEAQSFSEEYVYNSITETLSHPKKNQNIDNAIELYLPNPDPSNINENFTDIISKNPSKFIKNISENPMIYDLAAISAGKDGFFDNINIIIDNDEIKFETNNEKIKKVFLEASPEEKQQLREKQIFNYLNIPQAKVNYEFAKIAIRRKPIKMKVAFGDIDTIKALAESKLIFDINSTEMETLRLEYNFCFAGINDDGKSIVYSYCEVTEEGYTIPLEEENYSPKKYYSVFNAVLKMCKAQAKFIILSAPKEKKLTLVKEHFASINKTEDSLLYSVLKSARSIQNEIINDKEILNIVNNSILEILKEDVKNNMIDVANTIEIMKEFNLSKEKIIRIFTENAPKTDEIINSLLAVDESAVIQIYELKKLYNSLLKDEKLSEIKHNSNMYIRFADYERQFKKLQTIGFINYNNYEVKEWDMFMKEVYLLREKLNHVKKNIEDQNLVKQANDFFERIQDDYDAIMPVDNNTMKNILDHDLNKEINNGKFDIVMIASAIRFKYEEYLRYLEKRIDPKTAGSRKGRNLIRFTVMPKLVDDVYKHWKNLCTIIHKATSQNDPLWKGNDEDRKKALISALGFYNRNFAVKEEEK